jgi:hypothetical protein
MLLTFLHETPHARLYENGKGQQLWIPKSVCKSVITLPQKSGEPLLHDVTIEDWWLRRNSWPAGQRELL